MEAGKSESIRLWVEDVNKATCSESRQSFPDISQQLDLRNPAMNRYTLQHSATAEEKATLNSGIPNMVKRKAKGAPKGNEPDQKRARTEYPQVGSEHGTASIHSSSHTFNTLPIHIQRPLLESSTPRLRFVPFGHPGKPSAVIELFRFILSGIDVEPSDALK